MLILILKILFNSDLRKNAIVLGAGFKGMMASLKLSQKGFNVTLIEASKKFGGVLNSPIWDQMHIDLGCHLFFNQDDELTQEILKIIDHKFNPVPPNYASSLNKQISDDIAIPNFESLNELEKKEIYKGLLNPKTYYKKITSLHQVFVNRFGDKSVEWIDRCLQKSHLIKSDQLDPLAKNLLPYERIRIFDIDKALKLKEEKWYDDRIAVPRKENTLEKRETSKFSFFEFYPLEGGLKLFCENLHQILLSRGVNIRLGLPIESISFKNNFYLTSNEELFKCDYLYWAIPQNFLPKLFGLNLNLEPFIHSVALVLYYFTVDKKSVSNYTYLQNYDLDNYCFRFSVQSNYAENNIPENRALLCCEIPTKLGSPIWETPENFSGQIWDEAKKMGIVKNNYRSMKSLKVPKAFMLPKKGYSDNFQNVKKQIQFEKLLGIKSWDFSKNEILKDIDNELKLI